MSAMASLSPVLNVLLLFRQYVNLSFFEKYGLKHFVGAGLLTEGASGELEKLLHLLVAQGLAIPHQIQDNFFRLHPFWWTTVGFEKKPNDVPTAWENAFITYYDNYANGLNRKIESPDAESQQIGRHWVGLEVENLLYTHELALKNRRCIHSYYTLCNYFVLEHLEQRLSALAEKTLQRLDADFPQGPNELDVPYMKANALFHLGDWYFQQNQYRQARACFWQIIQLYEPLNKRFEYLKQYGEWVYDGQTRMGIAWMNSGNTWLRENKLTETEEAYLKAIEWFENFPNLHRLASAFNMLGAAYNQHRRFEESKEVYAQALEYAKAQTEIDDNQIGRILHNAAHNEMDLRDWESAAKYLQEALEIFRRYKDDAGIAMAMQSLGNLYAEQGLSAAARKAWKQSLEIFISLEDDFNTAILFQNLGNDAGEQSQNEEAKEYLERAKDIYERIGQRAYLGQAFHNLGMLAYGLEQFEEATRNFESAEQCYRDTNTEYSLAQILKMLGVLAVRSDNPDIAKTRYSESAQLFLQQNAPEERTETRRLLAEACFLLKEYEDAATWLREVMDDYTDSGQQEKTIEPLILWGRILIFLERDEGGLSKLVKAWQLSHFYNDGKKKEEISNVIQIWYNIAKDRPLLEKICADNNLEPNTFGPL